MHVKKKYNPPFLVLCSFLSIDLISFDRGLTLHNYQHLLQNRIIMPRYSFFQPRFQRPFLFCDKSSEFLFHWKIPLISVRMLIFVIGSQIIKGLGCKGMLELFSPRRSILKTISTPNIYTLFSVPLHASN